jgi:seryl-tRNA synthetase
LAGALARLHTALLDYAVDFVLAADPHFHLVDVPDAVRVRTATACGLQQRSAKNIMYTFKHDPQLCLSGTAELGINEWLAGTHFQVSVVCLLVTGVRTGQRIAA